MIKYPEFMENLSDFEYQLLEKKAYESCPGVFQNRSSITKNSLRSFDDETLCFLFSKLEYRYDCSEYGNDMEGAEIPYLICKEEMERRNLLNIKPIEIWTSKGE